MECLFISICPFAHERTHTHTHTHTHAHMHTHTSINEVPVCSCPFILKHVHARTHSRTHSCMHARLPAHTHARMHTRTHALTHKASCAVYCTSCPVYLSIVHVFGDTASLLVYLYRSCWSYFTSLTCNFFLWTSQFCHARAT
jgi:hypothetical protein